MRKCEHELVNWAKDSEGNRIYWCLLCDKQVVILAPEPLLPPIHETFGENWAQIISKVAK